jgi:hypothetical protein
LKSKFALVILLQLASFAMAFLIVIAHGSAQPLFEVQRESFCKSIQGRVPVSLFSGVAEMKKGESVSLWMEIKAGERAFTMLEAKQQMPIYHAWASDAGVTDMIDIGITKEKWLEQADAIRSEFTKRGFFTWRTQSMKRNFKEGRWYVSILDANKRPVRKVGSGVEAFRPEIVIRFIP